MFFLSIEKVVKSDSTLPMKKSPEMNLRNFETISSDSEDSSGGSASDSDSQQGKTFRGLSVLEQFSKFSVQNFATSESTYLPPFKEKDFRVAAMNTPFLPKREPPQAFIECALLMCASSTYFPKHDCDYTKHLPVIYMWKDCANVIGSEFTSYAQNSFKEHYLSFRPRIRFLIHIDPTVEKLNKLSMLRRDVPTGRVLYHYIGFGSPTMNESSISCLDGKVGVFGHFPLRSLLEYIRPPSFFLFDCDNSASALMNLRNTAAMKRDEKKSAASLYANRPVDWNDWFCIGGTDAGESLPSDPHLPRDFVTACIFTPVRMALICHALQRYRTTITAQFPLDVLSCDSLNESSEIGKDLLNGLIAVIDAIAIDVLSVELYKKLFRSDEMVRHLFQRFILMQYLLRPYQIHPVSCPQLPDMSTHCLWQQWATIADLAVATGLKPMCKLSSELFRMAHVSFEGHLSRGEEHMITKSVITLLFHAIEAENSPKPLKLLARFAACNSNTRKLLAESAVFSSLFSWLIATKDHRNRFHGICYLIVTLFRENPGFVHETGKDAREELIPALLFEEKLPEQTRALVAAILATLVSVNEPIRAVVVSKRFMSQISKVLEKSKPVLSLWLLLLLRRMFDSYGTQLSTFYNIGLYMQVASFSLHESHEIRASAIAVMACLLQAGDDITNTQLSFFALLCVFDGAYCVRYNLILFLGRLLSLYPNLDAKAETNPRNTFLSFYAQWFHCHPAYSDISNIDTLTGIVDTFIKNPNFISRMLSIAWEAVAILSDDPHPDVCAAGHEIRKLHTSDVGKYEKSKLLCESGGDALYRMCMGQLVNSACWRCPRSPRKLSAVPDSLPAGVLGNPPESFFTTRTRFRIAGCRITHVAYHTTSLSLAAATSNNQVQFDNEAHSQSILKLHAPVSSLSIIDCHHKPLVLTGCSDGSVLLWEPSESTPRLCLRADWPVEARGDLVIAPLHSHSQFVTSRGSNASIRLWDMTAQRIVSEWESGATDRVTSIAVNGNICTAGFVNGLIAVFDLRCKEADGPQRVSIPRPGEEVFRIASGLTPLSFTAATRQGSCIQWEDIEHPSFVQYEGSTLRDFDSHSHSPLLVFAPKSNVPVITDDTGRIIHTLKAPGSNSSCSFHSILPFVAFGTAVGDIIECQLS